MPQKEKATLVKTKGKRCTSEVSFGVFGIRDTNFGNQKKTGIKEIWGKRYIMEYVTYGMQSTEIVKFCNRKRYGPNIFATLTNKMWDSQPPPPTNRDTSLYPLPFPPQMGPSQVTVPFKSGDIKDLFFPQPRN